MPIGYTFGMSTNSTRYTREYMAKYRKSRRSYVSEIERLEVLVAWLSDAVSTDDAARVIGTLPMEAAADAVAHGVKIVAAR